MTIKKRIHIFRSEIFSVFRFGIPANKQLFAVLLRRRSVTSRLSFRVRLVAMPGAVCRFLSCTARLRGNGSPGSRRRSRVCFRPAPDRVPKTVLFLRRINPDFFTISVCNPGVLILYYIDCSCSFPPGGKEESHLGGPLSRMPRVGRMPSRTASARQNKHSKEHGHERRELYEFQADALQHPRSLVSAFRALFNCDRHETTTFRVPHRGAAAFRGRIRKSRSVPTSRHGCFHAHAGVFCNQKHHLPAVSSSIT